MCVCVRFFHTIGQIDTKTTHMYYIQAELFLIHYSFLKPSVPFRIRYSASGTLLMITLRILILHAT